MERREIDLDKLEQDLKTLPRDPILVERQATHGSFIDNAGFSQDLKQSWRDHLGWPDNAAQREALDMIALKLSRIFSGQAGHKDHWLDIAGYAKLGMEACND